MANNAANVSTGKPQAAGGIWVAPTGTILPTDSATPLESAFQSLGYVSEDGVTNGIESDSENIKAWGGDTVLTAGTSRTETFQFTAIETNEVVLKEVYGPDNVEKQGNGELVVKHTATSLPRRSYVFEILLTSGNLKRMVLPLAQVTEIGETVYVDGEPIGYELTVTAYPDEQSVTVYEYIGAIATDPEEDPEA